MSQEKRRAAEQWGREAEAIAADYLRSKGYTINAQRWKGGRCEIDIIAQFDDTVVLIEVKARRSGTQDPVEAVDDKKMRQMVRAADIYIGAFESRHFYRFDIIAITGDSSSYTINHIKDAFLAPLKTS